MDTQNSFPTLEQLAKIITRLRPFVLRLWNERKRLMITNASVLVFSIGALLLFVKPYYEVSIQIVPDLGNNTGLLGSLSDYASIAGISLQNAPPAEIYEKLIYSEAVLGPVILAKYLTDAKRDSINLIEYFHAPKYSSDPPELRERKKFLYAYKWMTEGGISTDVDRITRVLTVSIRASDGSLCAEIANNIVKSLDEYVRTKRKSHASNQLFYIEKRLAQVKDSLRAAENRLEDFSLRNRSIEQSPELRLEQTRLSREVDIQQLIYMELTKQYELTKIDVIKDTPIVNIVEWVQNPIFSPGPSKKMYLAIILFLSFSITLGYYGFQSEIHQVFSVIKDSIRK